MTALPADLAESFFTPRGTPGGRITLVGAGPGAADLLTLRALRRLQEAEVVFYDRLVDPEVLGFCPQAEHVFVGKEVGAHAWPQHRIDAVIVAAALSGRRVVRLKSGDPGIFGRATEELAAAAAHDIPVEIVPGVSAACAAGAALGRSLTERGETDQLTFATATCREGDETPDWAEALRPGVTLALYMAVRRIETIAAELARAGVPGTLEVEVVAAASTARERTLRCRLQEMVPAMAREGIRAPAIILIRYPKTAAAPQHSAAVVGAVQG